jgi:sporulation protein YtfJ
MPYINEKFGYNMRYQDMEKFINVSFLYAWQKIHIFCKFRKNHIISENIKFSNVTYIKFKRRCLNMESHPIDSLMKSTLENIKGMVDVNTIVGDAVESKDGSTIIPISKVSFGFATGGTEFYSKLSTPAKANYPFGGGSGAGISIKPVAFLVQKGEIIRLLACDNENTYDKVVDSIPQIIELIKDLVKSKQPESPTQPPPTCGD